MNAHNHFGRFGKILSLAASAVVALAQPSPELDGPPPDFLAGPGGPGGPPSMNQEVALLKKFDGNSDGWLNAGERKEAREFLAEERTEGRGGRGGFRGPGNRGNRKPPEAGQKVAPSDVKTYGAEVPFYAPDALRTVFIEFENADWETELSDFHNTDVEVPAKVTIDGKTYKDVGIHFRGMSSYMGVQAGWKRSLNLSMDYVHDGQAVGGYRTLNLLNAHEDPSYLRPVLFYDIAREYIPAPKANFVRVVINGEDWGIYNNVQQFNKDFVKDNFGTTKGARWKVRGSPGGQGSLEFLGTDLDAYKKIYTIKSKDDSKAWAALMELCRVLNETPPDKLKEKLTSLLDVEGALKFIALENALINNDGYWIRRSDYSIYLDEKGKFHIIPQDANETFATPGGGGIRIITPAFVLVRGFFDDGDKNSDGKLSSDELRKLGEEWFAKLDSEKAGGLTADQFATSMQTVLPEPRFRGPGGPNLTAGPEGLPPEAGGRTAGRAPGNMANRPNVAAALFGASDVNKDGRLNSEELKETFVRWLGEWDADKNSALNEDELQKGLTALLPPPPQFAGGGAGGRFRGGPGMPPEGAAGGPNRGPQMRRMAGPGNNMPRVDGVKLDPLVAANDATKPLISKLMAVPEWREKYLGYVREIAAKHLDWKNLGPRAERYHKLIDAQVKADSRKLDSYEAFKKSLTEDATGEGGGFGRISISLKKFADERREYLLNYKEK